MVDKFDLDRKIESLAFLEPFTWSHATSNDIGAEFGRDPLDYRIVRGGTRLEDWETMTDPLAHDPSDFRYVVHAVQPEHSVTRSMQSLDMIDMMQRGGSLSGQHVDLLRNPQNITNKPIISTSLIDQDKRATWCPAGYILRVPEGNVLRTARRDIGTAFYNGGDLVDELLAKRKLEGIADPHVVLAQTNPLNYNEIVLAGSTPSGQVQVVGAFVKALPNGDVVNPGLAQTIRSTASRYSLPVITIDETFSPYKDSDKPYVSDEVLAMNANGCRYMFREPNGDFFVYEFGGVKSRRMRPDERRSFLERVADSPGDADERIYSLLEKARKIPDSTLQGKVVEEQRYKAGTGLDTIVLS